MTKLYPYQKEGIRTIEKFNGRVLLADDMGLGKTVQALYYLKRNPSLRPAIIICPACLKWVWESQASQHCSLQTKVLSGKKVIKDGLVKHSGIIILNYDILSDWVEYLISKDPKVIIGDEIQAIKSPKARRSKAFKELCKKAEHIIAISGTPLMNRHSELYTVLNILWKKEFPSFVHFANRYCPPRWTPWGANDYRRSTNAKELHKRLCKLGMIRRLKQDVLKDLPSKTRIIIPMDIQNRREYEKAKNDFLNWLSRRDPAKARRASKAEELVKLGYLIRLSTELKMKSVFEWIDMFLEGSEGKLGLFMCHRKIVQMLHEKYKKISVVLTGDTGEKERKSAVTSFQKDKNVRIFIGNVRAAGVGIDLWAASTMAFVETGFVPADAIQCEDRFHRIGQKENVTCYYLVAKDTIEERLCKILQDKQKVITDVLDGKVNRKRSKLDVYTQLLQKIERE
jgi:SWI/SNF-related matrix-associated actin-dependent regulator of chromatin subfamily A-like protein 1